MVRRIIVVLPLSNIWIAYQDSKHKEQKKLERLGGRTVHGFNSCRSGLKLPFPAGKMFCTIFESMMGTNCGSKRRTGDISLIRSVFPLSRRNNFFQKVINA